MPRFPSATSFSRAIVSGPLRLALASVIGAAAGIGPATPARAYESEVEASLAAQFYTLESPYGEPLLRRRRYTNTLGMALYDLQGDRRPGGPTLSFRSRVRLDADLGQDPAERDPRSPRFVPGLEQAPFDLMYAYLEGERYFGGSFGFRLGRQYVADVLGWWSFDGADVALTTPAFLRLEAYGGLEQRAGLPLLTTPRYQADGVARGSRDDLRADQWTSYLNQSAVAPAFGVALETSDLTWLHARATYRRVTNRDSVVVSPFLPADGVLRTYKADRVSTERVGASARLTPVDFGALSGSLVYDFYNGVLSEQALGLDLFPTHRLTVGADYERILPTFDADSVFNWFSHSAMTSYTGRADLAFTRRLDAAVNAGARVFETLGDPATYAASFDQGTIKRELDPFAAVLGRYRYNAGSVSLRSQAELGARGHRVGADVTQRELYANGYYDSMVVLSLYDFKDELRPDRHATSFSYVLGGGVMPGGLGDRARVGFEWEHAMNRLVGQRYRLLATLDIQVFR
jgi:hypothetical protein